MNKKGGFVGVLIIWIGVLTGMFAITLVYIGMTGGIDILDETLGGTMTGDHLTTYQKVQESWDDWPIYCHIIFIVFGVVATIVETRDQPYGQ